MNNYSAFSTSSRILVSFWGMIVKLIIGYTIKQQLPSWPILVTSDQINEAIDNSYDLVKKSLAAYVDFQNAMNLAADKSNDLSEDQLNAGAFIRDNVFSEEEQETFKQKIADYEDLLIDAEGSLNSWRSDLEMLIEKWRKTWKNKHQNLLNGILEALQQENKITLSETEKQELTNPTKSRDELLTGLKKFYPDENLPKGWEADSNIVKLRLLWIINTNLAYHKTPINDIQTILKNLNKRWKDLNKEIAATSDQQEKNFKQLTEKLTTIVNKLPKERVFTLEAMKTYQTRRIQIKQEISEQLFPTLEG